MMRDVMVKTGNFARETKNFIKDIGEAISPFK